MATAWFLIADQAGVRPLSGYALQARPFESVAALPGDAFYLPYFALSIFIGKAGPGKPAG